MAGGLSGIMNVVPGGAAGVLSGLQRSMPSVTRWGLTMPQWQGISDMGQKMMEQGQPQQSETMNPMNMQRMASKGFDPSQIAALFGALMAAPKASDYATGVGGQGAGQSWTPRMQPRSPGEMPQGYQRRFWG